MKTTTKKAFAMSVLMALTLNLAACGSDDATNTQTNAGGSTTGTNTGGVSTDTSFSLLYASEVSTFNYLYTTNAADLTMPANAIDCLVEYDTYGLIKPSLAESWSSNEDATEWTFNIREGVKWVNHEGEEIADVTAHDWVTSAEWVNNAENSAGARYLYSDIILNASEYYDYTVSVIDGQPTDVVDFSEVGVKAVDDYTLVYTMKDSCPYFVSVLSYACYMPANAQWLEEQGTNFGIDHTSLLYNGAYVISDYQPQNQRVLTKNATYWDAENVFIEEIEYLYNATASTIGPEMFLRGEIDQAQLDSSILGTWLTDVDGKRDMVSSEIASPSYSYFYAFNFEPRFDDAYEPENWNIAVNNENFRQSIMSALDRVNAVSVIDPQYPENLITNTVTPPNFATGAGLDYTQYDEIVHITNNDSFDADKALEYKDLAISELEDAGCSFPVVIYMRYNPDTSNWDKECQLVEQQLEGLLGSDYIDIVVEAGPATGFLSAIRRSGDYALMKCNWGADYADPQTWADPFTKTQTYNFMNQDETRLLLEEPCDSKTEETQTLVSEYYSLVDIAKEKTSDTSERYSAFAEAEAFLIDHAFIIPIHIDANEYVATRLNTFESQYAPYGLAKYRYKGMSIREESMGIDEYTSLLAQWETEREQAIASAN